MTAIAASGIVTNLVDVLHALPTNESWLLLEHIPERWLEPTERDAALRFERYQPSEGWDRSSAGRIFKQDFEVRWQPAAAGIQVVYIGEYSPPSSLQVEELDLGTSRDRSYSLWGSALAKPELVGADSGTPVFAELRIPRLLRYPVTQGTRAARLRVREYLDPTTNCLLLSRFHSLEEER